MSLLACVFNPSSTVLPNGKVIIHGGAQVREPWWGCLIIPICMFVGSGAGEGKNSKTTRMRFWVGGGMW